ncbi:hypothetical protein F6R98_21060 [Candidatus Methylospira mobilis]|uniref:Uncharacterized protein n=2 Tax=Candidatus Methylospira mobilis TaxID=1808979 RepID=A0A5Q0BR87_9GAMM|nr:hypothetical protein F6R98_21060 [Candidatus Methylospira mobilis]
MSSAVLPDKPAGYGAVTDVVRQESGPFAADNAATALAGGDIDFPQLRERLIAYLNVLGIKDAAKSDVIAADALARARRKVAPGLHEELFRRALEDIQRNLDLALTRALGLGLASDARAVSGARAAVLMGQGIPADILLDPAVQQAIDIEGLRRVLPQATPPESALSMQEQPLSFFFGASSLAKTK